MYERKQKQWKHVIRYVKITDHWCLKLVFQNGGQYAGVTK